MLYTARQSKDSDDQLQIEDITDSDKKAKDSSDSAGQIFLTKLSEQMAKGWMTDCDKSNVGAMMKSMSGDKLSPLQRDALAGLGAGSKMPKTNMLNVHPSASMKPVRASNESQIMLDSNHTVPLNTLRRETVMSDSGSDYGNATSGLEAGAPSLTPKKDPGGARSVFMPAAIQCHHDPGLDICLISNISGGSPKRATKKNTVVLVLFAIS